jgi:hypothetical protein
MRRRDVQEGARAIEATGRDAYRFRELRAAHTTGHDEQRHEAAGVLLSSVVPDSVGGCRVLQPRVGGMRRVCWVGTFARRAPAGRRARRRRRHDRLTLGYRTAECLVASPLGEAGTRMRGHEFHYSTRLPAGDALDVRAILAADRAVSPTLGLLASYVHVHLAGQPIGGGVRDSAPRRAEGRQDIGALPLCALN